MVVTKQKTLCMCFYRFLPPVPGYSLVFLSGTGVGGVGVRSKEGLWHLSTGMCPNSALWLIYGQFLLLLLSSALPSSLIGSDGFCSGTASPTCSPSFYSELEQMINYAKQPSTFFPRTSLTSLGPNPQAHSPQILYSV